MSYASGRPPRSPRQEPSKLHRRLEIREVEQLYLQGQTSRLLAITADTTTWALDPSDADRLLVVRGMAMFDVGDVVSSLATLTEASTLGSSDDQQRFKATFALLLRASDFSPPEELLPIVSRLRQLAAKVGDAESL